MVSDVNKKKNWMAARIRAAPKSPQLTEVLRRIITPAFATASRSCRRTFPVSLPTTDEQQARTIKRPMLAERYEVLRKES